MKPLEQVLGEIGAALKMDATVGRAGLERWLALVLEAYRAEDARWLSEDAAMKRSGRRRGFFRLRRVAWAEEGYARRVGRAWFYYQAAVPKSRRVAEDDPRAQARRDVAA